MLNRRFGAQITKSSAGQKGGTGPNSGKKAIRFLCTGPDGQQLKKSVFNASDYQVPVSLWYQDRAGRWYLNTVTDKNNPPEWANNYIMGEAVKI